MDRAKREDGGGRAAPDDAMAHVESRTGLGIERSADTGQAILVLERPEGARHEALDGLEFLVGSIIGEPVSIAAVG